MYQMPALEWNEQVIAGESTTASAVLTNTGATTNILAGMVIDHPDFPYNTRVLSKTTDTITMDQVATGTTVAGSFSFFRRFEFNYPAQKDEGEQATANQSVTRALSGNKQTVTNYIELERALTFGFVTQAERDELRDDFYFDWALLGNSFRYYNDKEVDSFVEYQVDNSKYSQKRQVKKHPDYLYQLTFAFSRIRA